MAVVGAGLTGLAAAWELRDEVELTVLEAGSRPGGEIRTIELAGRPVDVGADAFLARQPEAEQLVGEVGLADDLVAPLTGQVHLWVRRRLRTLPPGTVLGAPEDPIALVRSRVLTMGGVLRAAAEPLLPRRVVTGDRSVADLVAQRFGPEVVDVLVEPLLAGVYAGRADRLSAQAAAPPLWAAASSHRSLTAGLREHRRRASGRSGPVFRTLAGGLSQLVERLAAAVPVRLGTRVTALTRSGGGWRLTTDRGERFEADQVVLALPAGQAAALLAPLAREVARELLGIASASVGVVALAYEPSATEQAPPGSGILVPRSEGRLVKAITLSSRKWPHHAAGGPFVLRASVGRVDDDRALSLDDDTLVRRVDAEVRWATGIHRPAVDHRVVRWRDALPQYDVGHLRRLDRIRTGLRELPDGLHLGGAAFDGVGLPARVRDARRLADAVRSTGASGRTGRP